MYIYLYACMPLHVCAYVHACIYMCMCMCMCMCVSIYMYMYVCIYIYMYLYITCMCSLIHLALGNEDGGVQLVYESACCLAWGAIFDRRKDSGVVCVFSIFDAGGSVCVRECVYTHTHTHSDVSPGVGMRHLEGPKNPDGLNLEIHIYVYVYKVHMCIYMLRGGMRSWTNCFFSLTYFFFRKRKAKNVNTNHR